MELNREHSRAIIFYNFGRGLTQQQCQWYSEVNRGRRSLQYAFREGHPKSVIVPEATDAVHKLILKDLYVTFRKISQTSIHSILHKHLTVKNIAHVESHTICQSLKRNVQNI